jgi:hypothetical protein
VLTPRSAGAISRCVGAVLLAATIAAPPAQAGTEGGEVVFRLTLEGPVGTDEGFYIDVRCDGGEFCNGADEPRYVYFCATAEIADAAICRGEDDTFEFSADIPPQGITYELYRQTEISRTDMHRSGVVLSGSWQVHEGRQVISLTYVYPGGAAPTLPDTAMMAP